MTWRAEPIWKGQACFIIGGGPSLLQQDLRLLNGHKVIVINSSYLAYPRADFLVWGDMRWWIEHRIPQPGRPQSLLDFKGKIVCSSSSASGPPAVLKMLRKSSPGLADDPGQLMLRHTSLTAAINLAVHLGVVRIVLLGIDQKDGASGLTHHHAPHRWKLQADRYRRQQADLPRIAEDLKARGIVCVNASPASALALWPLVCLEDELRCAAAA